MKLNRIKDILEQKGISQTWLAKQVGKSFSTINSYACNRYGAETVILWDARHVVLAVVLAVVLPQGLGVPCDAFPHIAAINSGLVHNFVERGAYTDECLFFCHWLYLVLVPPTPCRQAD